MFFVEHVVKTTNVDGEIYFHAVFTTNLNGLFGSAVCAFSLKKIQDTFDQGSFKEQVSSSSNWLPVLPQQVPSPRPGQVANFSLIFCVVLFIAITSIAKVINWYSLSSRFKNIMILLVYNEEHNYSIFIMKLA